MVGRNDRDNCVRTRIPMKKIDSIEWGNIANDDQSISGEKSTKIIALEGRPPS